MREKITVALIYGSVREGRFCDTIVNWAADELSSLIDIDLVLIDPRSLRDSTGGKAAIKTQLAAADAFILATPEYNHGYPAALKELIDSYYEPWHAKPIGFISYGGVSGGLRAVEQLRQVFAELHAVTVRDTVSFAHVWTRFDAAGHPFKPDEARVSLLVMMERIGWWARALKAARWGQPYNEAAA